MNIAGKSNDKALLDATDRFHRHRKELEITRKLYSSYFNTNGHGSYFYAFGYFYAARSLQFLPMKTRLQTANDIQHDLLSAVELDGT